MARNSKSPTTLDRRMPVCARCRSLLLRPQTVPEYTDHICFLQRPQIDPRYTDRICFLQRPQVVPKFVDSISSDISSIAESASNGCEICKRVLIAFDAWFVLFWRNDPFELRLCVKDFHAIAHPPHTSKTFYPMISLELGPRFEPRIIEGGVEKIRTHYVSFYGRNLYERSTDDKTSTAKSLVSQNTRDSKCLQQVDDWITNCSLNHRLCNSPIDPSKRGNEFRPTRLISVDKQGPVRLLEPDQARPSNHYYATLTHRWKEEGCPRLSRSNKEIFKKRINILALDAVFRDAIRLCQAYGIPYLWIDRLCIIQDDRSDLAQEISKMGYIYQNAYLNIGAVAAARPSATKRDGLFFNRGKFLALNEAFPVRVRRKGYDAVTSLECSFFSVDPGLNDSVLMSRGWVMQERLLSSRSIYFDHQLEWECCELRASEEAPGGIRLGPWGKPWGNVKPFRLQTLLSEGRMTKDHNGKVAEYDYWMEIVQQYSCCTLTNDNDRFPAISGLVKYFARALDDEYVAGLWRGDLFREILWCRSGHYEHLKSSETYPSEDIGAPTWSWASRKFDVHFFHLSQYGPLREMIPVAQIDEATLVRKGGDCTAGSSSAQIRITGPMYSVTRQPCVRGSEIFHDDYDYADGIHTGPPEVEYYLVMGYTEHRPGWDTRYHGRKIGLILKQVTGGSNFYKRVGIFKSFWQPWEEMSPTGESPLHGEDGPPSFDPSIYDRCTVTII